jgi:hypothetical protein
METGRNYIDILPADHQDAGETDPRIELYDEYAVLGESLEDFVDRMADDLGSNWVYKLSRR